MSGKTSTLVIGAAGAVGTRLVDALFRHGHPVVIADRLPRFPASLAAKAIKAVPNVDVREKGRVRKLFQDNPSIGTVWNLAAPLSVETALTPDVAEAVTIGGMKNVLEAMSEANVRKICFTDSIGSFGAAAPRNQCTARWLTENPMQDPGSDYGRQKRGCRELMKDFYANGGDPRWAVLPGVLHAESVWGHGTTEYALDALQAAARDEIFECPVRLDVTMPMIYASDLMRGMIALQEAAEEKLREPERGYCIPGMSFTAEQLFKEIRRHKPDFTYRVKLDPNMDHFSRTWPDELSLVAPQSDLGYKPRVGLCEMVLHVMTGHAERNARSQVSFQAIDDDGDGYLNKLDMHGFLSEVLFVPQEFPDSHNSELCHELVEHAFIDVGCSDDGLISFNAFRDWTKRTTLCEFVEHFMDAKGLTR